MPGLDALHKMTLQRIDGITRKIAVFPHVIQFLAKLAEPFDPDTGFAVHGEVPRGRVNPNLGKCVARVGGLGFVIAVRISDRRRSAFKRQE